MTTGNSGFGKGDAQCQRPRRVRTGLAVVLLSILGIVAYATLASRIEGGDAAEEGSIGRPPGDGLLSVEETLGLLFHPPTDGGTPSYILLANPEALGPTHKVLANADFSEFHPSAWSVLGIIGEEPDVLRLREEIARVKAIPGRLGPEYELLEPFFYAASFMASRDVSGAQKLAFDLQDTAFWAGAKFTLYADQALRGLDLQHELVQRAFYGYSVSLPSDLTERAQLIIRNTENPEYREFLRGALSPTLLSTHERNTRHRLATSISPAERARLRSYFNGDLENPGPPEGVLAAKEAARREHEAGSPGS